jgi:DNA-binding NtrC family response regulator
LAFDLFVTEGICSTTADRTPSAEVYRLIYGPEAGKPWSRSKAANWPDAVASAAPVAQSHVPAPVDVEVHPRVYEPRPRLVDKLLAIESRPELPVTGSSLKEQLAARELEIIVAVFRYCKGNATRTAKQLRISRPTLYDKLKTLGVSKSEGASHV